MAGIKTSELIHTNLISPPGEFYEHALLEKNSSVRGGAMIILQPAVGASGKDLEIKIQWWCNVSFPFNDLIKFKYHIRAFSVNAESLRIKNVMKTITDADCGAYLKEVGGDVLVSYNENFRFEPASSLKILHFYHSLIEIKNGNAAFNEMISVPPGGWCRIKDDNGQYFRLTLEEAMIRMMKNSDNECTEAIRRRFGKYSIRQTAQLLNMNSTLLVHGIGCGWSEEMGGHNFTTLHDLGQIYEKTADGSVFNDAERSKLISLMADGIYNEWLVIAQEEGIALGLAQQVIDGFKNQLYIYNKGGYYLNGGQLPELGNNWGDEVYNSIFGVLKVQVKDHSGVNVNKFYCYGAFVSSIMPAGTNSVNKADSARFEGIKELARNLIVNSLKTYL